MTFVQITLFAIGALLVIATLWHTFSFIGDKRTINNARARLLFPETDIILELLHMLKTTYTQQMHGEKRYGVFKYKNKYEIIFNNKHIALYGYQPESQVKILILQTSTFYSRLSSFDYIHVEEPYDNKILSLIELLRDALQNIGDERNILTKSIEKDLE